VNDELHGITGISNLTIADYLVGLAEKSKSAQDLMQKIRDTETLDVDQKVTDFAQTLFAKIPSNGAGKGNLNLAPNERQKRKIDNQAKERAAMELAAKNRTFKMVSDDEEEEIRYFLKLYFALPCPLILILFRFFYQIYLNVVRKSTIFLSFARVGSDTFIQNGPGLKGYFLVF
jgi:hypothetical protein